MLPPAGWVGAYARGTRLPQIALHRQHAENVQTKRKARVEGKHERPAWGVEDDPSVRQGRQRHVARRRPCQHLHRGPCTHCYLGRHRPVLRLLDTWQLVINTGTTIVTFLMVFLIQNSQNRDGAAIQVKLDELIRVSEALNTYVGIEHLTEEELEELRAKCERRAKAEATRVEAERTASASRGSAQA